MAALTANKTRDYNEGVPALWGSYEVKDNVLIYAGSAVTMADADGRCRPAVGTDEFFLGFSEQKVDMVTPASLAAGAKECKVRMQGEVALVVTGVSDLTTMGDTVYATADDTFTLTSTSAIAIGKVKRVITASSGLCIVKFQSNFDRSI